VNGGELSTMLFGRQAYSPIRRAGWGLNRGQYHWTPATYGSPNFVMPPVGLSNWCKRLAARIALPDSSRPQSACPTGTQGLLANEPDSPETRLSRGSSKMSVLFSNLRILFTRRHEAAGVFHGTKAA